MPRKKLHHWTDTVDWDSLMAFGEIVMYNGRRCSYLGALKAMMDNKSDSIKDGRRKHFPTKEDIEDDE